MPVRSITLGSILGWINLAQAAPETELLRVRMRGPSGCLSKEAVEAAILREDPGARQRAADVEVFTTPDGAGFDLSTAQGTASRRFAFDAIDCDRQLRVLGLSIALALEGVPAEAAEPDPDMRVEGAPPSGESPAPQAAPRPASPTVQPNDSPPRGRDRSSRPRAGVWLGFAPSAQLVTASAPLWGSRAQLRIVYPRWALVSSFASGFSGAQELGSGSFRLVLVTAGLEGCRRWARAAVSTLACAGLEAGSFAARGGDFLRPRAAALVHGGATVALELAVAVAPLASVILQAGSTVPFGVPQLRAGAASTRVWPVWPRVGVGVAIRWDLHVKQRTAARSNGR
jgi:hypothetical protein